MKKIVNLFLLLLLFPLVSCQADSSKVYLFIYDMNDPYIEQLSENIVSAGKNYFDIEVHDAQNSQIIQNERIEEVLKLNPSLLIINPVDRLGVYPIIEKAKEMDIPVIFINREPLEKDLDIYDQAYYVGAKAEQSGILQAEIVASLFGGNPLSLNEFDKNNDNIIQAIIFKGEQGHQDAELRTEYIESELEGSGFSLDVLTTEICDWNEDIARDRALTILPNYPEVEVIISNNDAMAIGAIEAMIELGIFVDTNENSIIERDSEPWLPVIGIDGISEAVSWMQRGYLYATVLNDALGQASATVDLAQYILFGTDLSTFDISLENTHYVWVDYEVYTLTES
ncbi:MAG: galactose ABC transporter substrate-binding protein [Candidatus Izemoplasmatales bacterium]